MAQTIKSQKAKKLVITISGVHGSGKSTQARRLAEYLSLRYFSAGVMFREMAKERRTTLLEFTAMVENDERFDRLVDEGTRREAERGGVILDGLLSGWMARDLADLKLYLSAPDDVRFGRIAERDGITLEEARQKTLERDRKEKERFKRFYNFDIDDVRIYDLVLNTEFFDLDGIERILRTVVEEYIVRR